MGNSIELKYSATPSSTIKKTVPAETSSPSMETVETQPTDTYIRPEEESWTQKTLNYAGGVAKGIGNEALKTVEGIRQAADTAGKAIPTHALAKGLADATLGKGTQGFTDGWNETQKAWSDIGNGAKNLASTAWNVSSPARVVNGFHQLDQINKLPSNLSEEERRTEINRISESNPSYQASKGLVDGLTGIPSVIESGGDPERVGEAVFKIGSAIIPTPAGKAKAATQTTETAVQASQFVDASKVVSKEIPTTANNIVPFARKAPTEIVSRVNTPRPKAPNNGEAGAVAVAEKPILADTPTRIDLQSTKQKLEDTLKDSPGGEGITNKKDSKSKGGNSGGSQSSIGTLTADRSSSSGNGSSGGNSSAVSGGGNRNGKVNGSSGGNGNSGSSGKSTALNSNQEELITLGKQSPDKLKEKIQKREIGLEELKICALADPQFAKLLLDNRGNGIAEQIKVSFGKCGSLFIGETSRGRRKVSTNTVTGKPKPPTITRKTRADGTIVEKSVPDQIYSLEKVKASPEAGLQLEASTADLLTDNNITFTHATQYHKILEGRFRETMGELDFRVELPTSKRTVVIEAATAKQAKGASNKYDQITNKYVLDVGIVKPDESIILYAPNYPEDAQI